MEPRKPGKTEQAIAVLSMLVMLWAMMPEHQRRLIIMRAVARLRALAGQAARGQGHAGMGDELAGHAGQAGQRYGAAYALSRLRDRLAAALDRMRP